MMWYHAAQSTGTKGPTPNARIAKIAGLSLARMCERDNVHPVRQTHAICVRRETGVIFLYGYEIAPGVGLVPPLEWLKANALPFRFGTTADLEPTPS